MIYLVLQIIAYLIVALLIGFSAGWLLQRLRSLSAVRSATNEAADRVENAEAKREAIKARLASSQEDLIDHKKMLANSERKRELQVAEIASLKMDLSGFKDKDATIKKFRHEADNLRQQLRSSQESAGNYRSQLEIKARETAEYRLRAEKAYQQVVAMEKSMGSTRGQAESTDPPVSDMRSRIGDLTRLVQKRDSEIQELEEMLTQARSEASTMREQTEIARSQLHALEAQIKDVERARDSHSRSRSNADVLSTGPASAVHKGLRDELAERTRKYAVLDADYKILKKKFETLSANLAAPGTTAESHPLPTEPAIEKKTANRKPEQPEFLLDQAPVRKDDLKQIFGIGPVIEQTLNDIGIYKLEQIAGMTTEDIRWVADSIDYFPKRIEQDDWMKQARDLLGKAKH
ncbi:MAG: hypothetical protein HKN43_03990 [Rhodothermales bacterium]|nr:hypothetical protein [Rhodothermales bacterium]